MPDLLDPIISPEEELPEEPLEPDEERRPDLNQAKQDIQDIQKMFQKKDENGPEKSDKNQPPKNEPTAEELKNQPGQNAGAEGGSKAPTGTKADLKISHSQPPSSSGGGKVSGDLLKQLKAGHQKVGKIYNAKVAAQDLKENKEEYAKQYLKEEVKQIAKRVVAQAAKAVGEFLTTNPIGLIILGIIVVIFVVLGIVLAIYAFGHSGGVGVAKYPSTAAERQEVSTLAALTDSQLANSQYLQKVVAAEKQRLGNVKTVINSVYKNDSAKAQAATADLTAIINSMDAVVSAPTLAQKHVLIAQITAKLQAYYIKYPELVGAGAVNGGTLPVIPITEGQASECGVASTLSVVLYYNPGFTDSKYYDPTTRQTVGSSTSCVSPSYIDEHIKSTTNHLGWNFRKFSEVSKQGLLNSLRSGDPVILYTAAGGIYNNTKHIVTIIGYNPTDQAFIVNSTTGRPGGVQVSDHPNGHLLTWSNIQAKNGDGTYGHSFIIRDVYVK